MPLFAKVIIINASSHLYVLTSPFFFLFKSGSCCCPFLTRAYQRQQHQPQHTHPKTFQAQQQHS